MKAKSIFTRFINLPIVMRYLGWLLMIEAAFMVTCVAMAAVFHEWAAAGNFAICIAITFGCGAAMTWGIRSHNRTMRKREGIFLTAIVWLAFSLFGMLPYLLNGSIGNVTDAYFETMSGFTTTGASVMRNLDGALRSVLFWRALTHWIGGMGIILFSLAVLPMLNYKGGITLFNAEVTGITHERNHPRVSQTAKDLWLIYLVMTVVMLLLLVWPMGWFDALCHTLATVSTGGFSTKDEGINYWNSYYVDTVVMVFMFMGGIKFTLLASAAMGKFKPLCSSDSFRCYVILIATFAAIIIVDMAAKGYGDNWLDRILYSTFDAISSITSTGYSTIDYENAGQFVPFMLMVLMFFGGMAGSTSGGAKVDRLMVTLKNAKNEFYRMLHPNAVKSVWVDHAVIPQELVVRCLTFLSVFTMCIAVGSLLLTMVGLPVFDSIFTSMSAMSNIGLGYGMTGLHGSFAAVPCVGKWVLIFEMVTGRLEVFTMLLLFSRAFWAKE